MSAFIPPEEYYNTLPRKYMASAVLLFNKKKELLILKTGYKKDWEIPGGVIEKNESPLAAAIREIQEEIGLEMDNLQLFCVDWKSPYDEFKGDCLQFIFSGGALTEKQIAEIKFVDGEITEYKFLPPKEALPYFPKSKSERIKSSLIALENKTVVYMENKA